MSDEKYLKFVNEFLSGNLNDGMKYFKENNYLLEYAYCLIVDEKFKEAYDIFLKLAQENTRAHWAMFIIEAFYDSVVNIPSYFEIRNFLEIDLNIFMKYDKFMYVKKLISYIDYMSNLNPETAKYIGRVLWANGYLEGAMHFLEKAKDYLYNDPELHYLLAYIYYEDYKDISMTKKFIDSCLEVLPNYYPACALNEKISAN